jgi:hypothetical protein
MSLITTIALMTTAVVAKLRPDSETKRIAELERQVEELEVQLDAARSAARDWEVLSHSWRSRYEQAVFPQMQQAQQAAGALQQYAMQNQMLAQQQFCNQGLAQMPLNPGFEDFCNCVPSRTQVWESAAARFRRL